MSSLASTEFRVVLFLLLFSVSCSRVQIYVSDLDLCHVDLQIFHLGGLFSKPVSSLDLLYC